MRTALNALSAGPLRSVLSQMFIQLASMSAGFAQTLFRREHYLSIINSFLIYFTNNPALQLISIISCSWYLNKCIKVCPKLQ